MLSGVMTLEASPKYRIETWSYNGINYYKPQKKVWYRTNYFPLPFKIWVSTDYPFHNKREAEEIIDNWKKEFLEKQNFKHSKFIYVN